MIDPADPRFVIGTDADQRRAREEFRRQQQIAAAMRSPLPEIPRSDLEFHRFGQIEDRASGNLYRAVRGDLVDPSHSTAIGYYLTEHGLPVYLERPVGSPQNRAELEAKQAELEQRRNSPKPRPAWAKR